jgi:signal transduction histidine kinase/ActR/RegA family two-component response regulator
VSEARHPRGDLIARVRSSPLGVKLALLSALLTAVVVGTGFEVLRIRTGADVRRVFVAELNDRVAALRQLQDRDLRLLLATSAVASTSPTLRAALSTLRSEGDAGAALETIQREAARLFEDLHRELLIVTDDSGRVVASSGPGAPRRGQSMLALPAVRYALQSENSTADSAFGVLSATTSGDPMQVGCVPILMDGFPIGALMLGERVDSLLPRPTSPADTRGVVTAGGLVVASTLNRAPVGARWETPVLGAAGSASLIWLGGEAFVSVNLPLGLGNDGHPVVLYLMRSLTASVAPITHSLARRFLLVGALAVLLVGAGGALVSRTTLRPLSRFVAFIRSGSAQGASRRFNDPLAPAEIATLTDAYNVLIASLGQERLELERRTVELATTNETLRRQVEERQRAERALRESEEQLRQSQKLEALGALAGGVAHDFNNLLSVIMSYAEFVREGLPAESRARDDVEQISSAGQRASGLVRQLLAFSRKQVLQPQVIDLNQVVTGMQPLLRTLLAEEVVVETRLAPELGRVMADPGQIEQVILNLAVNARDAMPAGGTLLIETANVTLDRRHGNLPLAGGPAVMLLVSDTGVGMDAATRQRIFEPFFTTKALGKGTGRGLSTVYGIVRQSAGNITVFSEPGCGATFRCYFPPVVEPSRLESEAAAPANASAGSETILIAEDEGQLRESMRRALQRRGYQVLEASHGREALEVAAGHTGPIDLLITDVVMPLVSGKELAERLQAERPGVRVLFVSGYASEAVERHGVLAPDSRFLQKPIAPDALARAARELLDAELASRGEE